MIINFLIFKIDLLLLTYLKNYKNLNDYSYFIMSITTKCLKLFISNNLKEDIKYRPEYEHILESELQDMYQGDIPFFETLTNSSTIVSVSGGPERD